MKFRKTALIDAERFTADQMHPREQYPAGRGGPFGAVCVRDDVPYVGFHIHTLEGWHEVTSGDWIARGIDGEFWPIKPDIFARTYETAE